MTIPKIVLYYAFTPLSDPDAVRLWQRDLCESLGLRGRIIVSPHGINGTLGGELGALKKYVRKTREYAGFARLDVKWSEGTGFDTSSADARAPHGYSADFPKLSVKVRDELVSFGAPGEVVVDSSGVVDAGKKLHPQKLHALVQERGDDVVFFDGRNAFEAEIGRFKGAVIPNVSHTRDFVDQIDSGVFDDLKDKAVVTYCTGGIRCEVLSSLLKKRGFNEVYQLAGGIVRYGETFGDDGLWEGSLYVFDKRMSLTFSDDAVTISACCVCHTPTSSMRNCADLSCREQFVVCNSCSTTPPVCTQHVSL